MLRTEELRKVQTEVKGVKSQVTDLQKSVDDLNLAQGGTSSKMKADLTLMLKELQGQITRLQSQIEETQYRLNNLGVKLDKLDQKKIIMGGTGTTTPGATAPPGSPTTPASATSPAPEGGARVVDGLDLENLFNQARDDYIRGKYDLALSGFKSVYEKDPGSNWKELAMFWLGETMMKQDRADKALEAYQRVIKEFPHGTKTCAARFKSGLIYNQKKENVKRDEEWNKLISDCPGTNEAQRAQEMQKE